MEFHFIGFFTELMKVLINEFKPCDIIFITKPPAFALNVYKCVFQICTSNRLIQSIINILLIISSCLCIIIVDSCIDKINISSMCALMRL